ncbi:hypothetical protein DV738_g2454, partial [Chaetothyriales sp. CBS 135597]
MPGSISRARRLIRPVLYTTAGIAVVGTAAFYIAYRPIRIPGSQGALIPPPTAPDGTIIPPKFPQVKSREQMINELRKSADEEYDLLVIGGGATGTGIALDAVTRGLRVALVDRDDFASGTSSKSTKLVHGGVRYLEKAVWELDYNQYSLVKEALRERKYFLDTAPHLSSWLPIMIPLQKWWQAPYFWAGAKAYDFLAGSEGIEKSYFLSQSRALDAFPMLKRSDLIGAMVYYDGAHNDSRMNISLAATAAVYGATVVNHLEVTGLTKGPDGKLNGAVLKDVIAEKDGRKADNITVRAKGVINATGPFTDAIRKMDDPTVQEIVAPSSGVHVVLPGYYSPQANSMGLIDPSTSDGRVIFFLPWQGNTIAGTTDAPCKISRNPVAGEEEITWILNEIRSYLAPDINVRRGDVLAAWSGIRPLVKDPKAKNTESLVRNHLITLSDSGLLTCAGGKWTTYRQMAEDAVDEAIKAFSLHPKALTAPLRVSGTEQINDAAVLDGTCQTHQVRLVGAHGWSKTLFINLIQHFGLETEVAQHLAKNYGDRAWTVAALSSPTEERFPVRGKRLSALYPFVDGEVRYAVRHEFAQRAVDVIARRTRLSFLNAQAALEALPKVIDLMAEELKWDSKRKEAEWKDSVEFLASMGLPNSMLGLTRKDVESGKSTFASDDERKRYSRFEKHSLLSFTSSLLLTGLPCTSMPVIDNGRDIQDSGPNSPEPAASNANASACWRRRTLEDVVQLIMLKKDTQEQNRHQQQAPAPTVSMGRESRFSGATVVDSADNDGQILGLHPVTARSVGRASTAGSSRTDGANMMEAAGYATMSWWQCGMLMVAETISLGILTLPRAVADLGLVAGMIILIGMGLMATYTGYLIGQFALLHRGVQSMTEAGEIILGRFGRELCFWGANSFIIFIMGSHLVVFRKMFDALTDNRYCGMAWTALAFVISFCLCMPRQCRKMFLLSAASFVSICATVAIVIADIVIHYPELQQQDGFGHELRAWPKPGLPFHVYFNSLCNITFAYAGHVAFYVFIAELRDPRDFPKALAFLQVSDITIYALTGAIIYVFARDNVKAPAIESASPLFVKIAYGVASVTIVIAGVINGHVVAKALYKIYFRKTPETMGENTWRARIPWYAINAALWLLAYLLAEAIPVFSNIVGLTGALFASWFTFGIPAFYWFHMAFSTTPEEGEEKARSGMSESWGDKVQRWRRVRAAWPWQTWTLFALNCFIVAVATAICVIGIYSSARSIQDAASSVGRPFSCKHTE